MIRGQGEGNRQGLILAQGNRHSQPKSCANGQGSISHSRGPIGSQAGRHVKAGISLSPQPQGA
jgi:hypothetical protein